MSKNTTELEQILVSHMNSKALFHKLYKNIIVQLAITINTLISYPGGKFKMRKELNLIYNELSENNSYDTLIDPFCGMGGSIKSLEPSLIKSGVKKIIMNDINIRIITLHENVRNHKDEMIEEIIEIIREKILKRHNRLFITIDELHNIQTELREEFYTLQNNKDFGISLSVRLILLAQFNYSGVMTFQKNGDIRFVAGIYDAPDIKGFLFNAIESINVFNRLYNQFEMKFYNNDYFEVYNNFKYLPNTLWNIDTVYVKENYSEYIESEMDNLQNHEILGCSCNYSKSSFPHIEVLETLKDIDFIYNNNIHPIIQHFKKKLKLNSIFFERKESINAKDKTEVKRVTEVILYQNNFSRTLLLEPINKSVVEMEVA